MTNSKHYDLEKRTDWLENKRDILVKEGTELMKIFGAILIKSESPIILSF
jgi:hypothetical protein